MVQYFVTEEQNTALLLPFSELDVKDALDSMHPNKAAGMDGLNPAFFQKFWSIVGKDVSEECLRIINSGSIPPQLNQIAIVLIPKRSHLQSMNDLRPISLCNVIYKIIAKMLANRLKD